MRKHIKPLRPKSGRTTPKKRRIIIWSHGRRYVSHETEWALTWIEEPAQPEATREPVIEAGRVTQKSAA